MTKDEKKFKKKQLLRNNEYYNIQEEFDLLYEQSKENIDNISRRISDRIHQIIGINVPVTIVPAETIERSIGKAKRIIDER